LDDQRQRGAEPSDTNPRCSFEAENSDDARP
jgi:hypothetical protein